jgi:hypothetical protein
MVVASFAKLRLGFLIFKLKTLYYLKALFHDPFRWHGLIPPERVMCGNSDGGSGAGLRRRCGLANQRGVSTSTQSGRGVAAHQHASPAS